MRKTHFRYLRKAVGAVAGGEPERVEAIKSGNTPVYQLIRDIICDARFYGVTDDDDFWKDYSSAVVGGFIDSLSEDDWAHEEKRTGKKEDFLNRWLSEHMIPFSEAERTEISRKLRELPAGGTLMFGNAGIGRPTFKTSEFTYGFGVRDMTDSDDDPEPDIPDDIRELFEGNDDSMAGLQSEWRLREGEYVSRMDPMLVKIARRIGRCGGEGQSSRGLFSHASKSDISGITVGDDLNRMLPHETAMLSDPVTEGIFLHRYVSKRLQLFSSASVGARPTRKERGPIFVCIDTSGSMTGEPENLAKRLAVCISVIAGREGRPVFLVNYSHTLSFFVLTGIWEQRQRLLSFISRSYSGGNDEQKLFRFLFRSLPCSPSYKRYVEMMKGADLLIVSDFQWDKLDKTTTAMIDKARGEGMRVHALGVNMGYGRAIDDRERFAVGHNHEEGYRSGYDFFCDCNYRYVAAGNRIMEV